MSYAAYHVVCDGIQMECARDLEHMRSAFETQKKFSGWVELRGYPTLKDYEKAGFDYYCDCVCFCDKYGFDECICYCESIECKQPSKYDILASWNCED